MEMKNNNHFKDSELKYLSTIFERYTGKTIIQVLEQEQSCEPDIKDPKRLIKKFKKVI